MDIFVLADLFVKAKNFVLKLDGFIRGLLWLFLNSEACIDFKVSRFTHHLLQGLAGMHQLLYLFVFGLDATFVTRYNRAELSLFPLKSNSFCFRQFDA